MRTCAPAHQARVHGGSINLLTVSHDGKIVTGSADRTIKIFDLKQGLKPIATMNATDAVFSGEVIDNLILVGSGDGNLLAYDIT